MRDGMWCFLFGLWGGIMAGGGLYDDAVDLL